MSQTNHHTKLPNKRIRIYINIFLQIINTIVLAASLMMLGTIVYESGFNITERSHGIVQSLYKFLQIIFLVTTTLRLIFETSEKKLFRQLPTRIILILLYLSVIGLVFNEPEDVVLYTIWSIIKNKNYIIGVLAAFSVLQISDYTIKLLDKKTNPSLILVVSFLVLILFGTGLLMLPKSTVTGISFIDALFIATSSVCVTGLSPVDISTVFTPLGHLFIIILIQIGGLGLMTITSFFALFFMGNNSIYNRLIISDVLSTGPVNSLLNTLLKILGFTLIIEGSGAFLIWISTQGSLNMDFHEEVAFSVFHSVSAFCNAGFSTMSNNLYNPLLQNQNSFLLVISFLIIFGGIGFPIMSNIMSSISYQIRKYIAKLLKQKTTKSYRYHLYNLNTKIVLIVTILLLIIGTVLIAFFEWNNAFAGMSLPQKLTQAFFNAVTPRTAGFNSLNMQSFTMQTLLLTIALMWIGGASQSTAGGIKVNAFAVIILNMWSTIRGKEQVEAYDRVITNESVHRANATAMISIIIIFIALFLLSWLEPDIPLLHLLFECVSAIGTVGLSLDTTSLLGSEAKSIIILLMFSGRVGVTTLLLGIIQQAKPYKYKYPSDNIIIN